MSTEERIAKISSSIRIYQDFPKPGIKFRDIFSLMKDPALFSDCIRLLVDHVLREHPDTEIIAGLDSRGFIFGPVIAQNLNLPFVPIRKRGKLPGETHQASYSLEYGEDILEIQKDGCYAGQKVIVVDDVIATGGTMGAAVNLVKKCGGVVLECLVVMELADLKGRDKLDVPTWSLVSVHD